MKHKEKRRSREGAGAGVMGLICNLLLAAAKFFAGMASNSVVVMADVANHLADGFSALLTMLGFWIEAREKDALHPYGHGRIEYVIGFLISLLIIATGIGVGKTAVTRVFWPQEVSASALTICVLLLSVFVKLGMMLCCQRKNKKLKSPALEAMRKDSLSDACVSALTLAGFLAIPRLSLPLDGILGGMIAVYIVFSGTKGLFENLGLLLGEGPSQKTENELKRVLTECPEIESVGSIAIHDYGPNQKIAAAEVKRIPNRDKEAQRRIIDEAIRFCKESLNVEVSLYASLYK